MTGGAGRHRSFLDLSAVVLPQVAAVDGASVVEQAPAIDGAAAMSHFREQVGLLQKKTRAKVLFSFVPTPITLYLIFWQMRTRANNRSEKHFKVGSRVLLKNLQREKKANHRWHNPGRITSVNDGAFTIELEAGGTVALAPSSPVLSASLF